MGVRSILMIAGLCVAPKMMSAQAGSVTFIDSAAVSAAFARGAPLVEVAAYKVHASRREGPGRAEVHVLDTDIIHVLSGTATLVTGGAVVAGQTTAPGEIRGDSVDGGTVQMIRPGDVIIVPNGVPHWFKQVSTPFLYYVVKVTDRRST